ncbi:MAG: ABC transporter permease [Chitinophagaceae bacterium]|nr:MAG: ABC transporter permease [Chitinophagaceae bacterium]
MRTILFILQKEFLQIFRNKGMLPIIFFLPLIQLLILAYAANYDIKNITVDIIDNDHSLWSERLTHKIFASGYFKYHGTPQNIPSAMEDIKDDRADMILVIPPDFEQNLIRKNKQEVQILINAINGMKAGIGSGYIQSILQDYNIRIRKEWMHATAVETQVSPQINVTDAYWYNPYMDYKQFMVPGILVVLVTMIGAFLSGMNIVREKETGTIDQLNVTPIRKVHFIIGKLMPFWIIAMAELAFGLVFSWWFFHLSYAGNIWLIFLFAGIYLIVMLGIGLLISTQTQTQQQAMFITWFFFVIFLLLSGLFTPVNSMPQWAQRITLFNPVAWFIKVIRMVLIKGSGFSDILPYLMIITLFALIINSIAILTYRKKS